MLKIVKNPEFTSTVKVSMPASGGFADASFTARFRALTISEAEQFNLMSTEGTTDYLRAILIGWDGVSNDDGEMSFNDAARDDLIDIAPVRIALLNSYNAAMMGAKRGN